MNKNNKVINRDSVYGGKVISVKRVAGTIYESKAVHESEIYPLIPNENELRATYIFDYRSIMFTPNQRTFATDLLYNAVDYPILNITDKEICMKSEIVIANAVWLGPILKSLGYEEQMSLKDLKKARKILFSGNFIKKNSELFGFERLSSYEAHQPEINSELRIAIGKYNYRSNPQIDSPLPSEYMQSIELLDNNEFHESLDRMAFTKTFKRDSFKPTLDEMIATKQLIKRRKNYNNISS